MSGSVRTAAVAALAALFAALLAGCAIPGRMAEPQGMGPSEAREAILDIGVFAQRRTCITPAAR